MNGSGQFQPWKGYACGALASPHATIAAEIDRDRGGASGTTPQYADGGILMVSINAQSLRGDVKMSDAKSDKIGKIANQHKKSNRKAKRMNATSKLAMVL